MLRLLQLARRASTSTSTTGAPAMFCYQCEQTRDTVGCKTVGVCGKTPEVAALQDNLVEGLKGISVYANRLRELGVSEKQLENASLFTVRSLFSTMTNVNFDPARFEKYLGEAHEIKNSLKKTYSEKVKGSVSLPAAANWTPNSQNLVGQGRELGVLERHSKDDPTVASLQELLTYGLKGMCAYAEHAEVLGRTNPEVFSFVHRALDYISQSGNTVPKLLELALECGKHNITVMGMLDEAHNSTFGTPSPHKVSIVPTPGKHAILVSGHDLKDLRAVLEATAGKGIDVYTHGEMLPAHGYPTLRAYPHLKGNFGGAWQLQKFEFSQFPGAILMTTNCLIEPLKSYKGRLFTNSVVGWPGVTQIKNNDFSGLVKKALELPGFDADDCAELAKLTPSKTVTVGFGHKTVLSVADKVLDAVKKGDITRFIVMGGCDGSEGERSYYTTIAKQLPKEAVILTLGCGKYRFNKLDLGEIKGLPGIPRVLDLGQCNDAFSAVTIASALANALKTDINSLPLSLVISWFEQKAVAVLLSLLHLGIKDIRLGPTLPAFVTPTVLDVLVKAYGIKPISAADPRIDLQAILGK